MSGEFTDVSVSSGMRNPLRSLVDTAKHLLMLPGMKERVRNHPYPQSDFSVDGNSIPSLSLSIPDYTDSLLGDMHLPPQVLNNIRATVLKIVRKAQQIHRQRFEEACEALCRAPQNDRIPLPYVLEQSRQLFEEAFVKQYIPVVKEQIIAFRSRYKELAALSEPKKVPFNAESTPLLEKYFQHNAYPSAPDRQVLAQKTNMSPRQIEVWFQNHRKRARESGKSVKKLGPHMPMTPSSERNSPCPAVPSNERSISDEDDSGSNCADIMIIPVSVKAEVFPILEPDVHVFPNRFSHSTALYRMDTNKEYTFSAPIWQRVPASGPKPQHAIDIDDFVANFASRLNIRIGTFKSKRKARHREKNALLAATTTVPFPAPLPAFIPLPQPPSSHPSHSSCPPSFETQPSLRRRSTKKSTPFPKRYPSKYHPYSRVSTSPNPRTRTHSIETFFEGMATPLQSMPRRANNSFSDSVASDSWVAHLEAKETYPSQVPSEQLHQLPSHYTASNGSRTSSMHSISSLGSRISSISSNSSQPFSPTIPPQDDGLLIDGGPSIFLPGMADFDLMFDEEQYNNNILPSKPDLSSFLSQFPFCTFSNTFPFDL